MSVIDFELNDGIAVITLNRPEVRNTINEQAAREMEAHIRRVNADDAIRVGIITGQGDHFCAGMDVKAFLAGETIRLPESGFAGIAQVKLLKPIIAAVEGYAVGGGFEVATACDIIVAGKSARFGHPEVKLGLVANAGGLLNLPSQMPERIAKELMLTGDLVGADDVARYGLVNHVVSDGHALYMAMEIAGKICANGPLAIAASKRVMLESKDWRQDEKFEKQFAITQHVFDSEDAQEGARAFAEKRKPEWKGK